VSSCSQRYDAKRGNGIQASYDHEIRQCDERLHREWQQRRTTHKKAMDATKRALPARLTHLMTLGMRQSRQTNVRDTQPRRTMERSPLEQIDLQGKRASGA
jgi:hypothetical protein